MLRLSAVPDSPRRACLYARVSMVGDREDIISPEIQVHAGRDKAAESGWQVAVEITELDVSGRNFARAGVRRAIEGVEAGAWEIVAVYRYDRFGRNVRDSLVNIARVEAAGGEVVSCTEPFDAATAIGKYGRTNLLAVAELQSDIIGENWKAAHARRRARGLPHNGALRLGYVYLEKRYEPDPDFAPIVRELYRRYIAGEGLYPLADYLNRLGAPTRTRTSRGWTNRGVASLLFNGFAAGYLHSTTTGEYVAGVQEPLISEDTWRAFLAANRRRQQTPRRLVTPATPLSGLVHCAGCGKRMRTHADHTYGPAYTFQCANRECPDRAQVTRRRVEAEVRGFLAELDRDVSARARARTRASDLRAGARAERKQLAREVTRLDRALVQLAKDKATGLLPERIFRSAGDEILADRDAAAGQLDRLGDEAQVKPPTRAVVRGLLADWDILPVVRRRELLGAVLCVLVARKRPGPPSVRLVPAWDSSAL